MHCQVHHTGFFSVTGTGFTEDEVQRQYEIGQAFFDLPDEERDKPGLRCDFGKGNYFGYRAVCCALVPPAQSSTYDLCRPTKRR